MKRRVKLTETDIHNIVKHTVRKILKESYDDVEGSEGIVQVLEKNGCNHTAARAMEGALTYVAGIKNFELLTRMAQYVQKAVDDEHEYIMNRQLESVKRVLRGNINEVSGWTLEKDDVTWVNGEEDGSKPWMVRLWTGSGYYLPAFGAFAEYEEDALEKVVAYLDNKGDNDFFCDEYIEEMKEELAQEGKDEEEIQQKIDNEFCYVDATMDGANEPHYVFWENLAIYPYDEKGFK